MPSYDVVAIAALVREAPARCGAIRVVTVDGPAGSGKTTLAAALANELGDCPVIHMDDLYDGWSQDLDVELAERIETSLLDPLKSTGKAAYRRYDWYVNSFTDVVSCEPNGFLILEGVGSGNKRIRAAVTLALWVESDPKLLIERVVARDGEQLREELVQWQQREAQYFVDHDVKQAAAIRVRGDD